MTMNVKDYNLRKLPNTIAKEMIKEASMSSYELFVRDHYDDFVQKNKFQTCSSRTFIANMKKFKGNSKARWVNGKTQKVYNLL